MKAGVQSSLVRYGVAVGCVLLVFALYPLLASRVSATFLAFLAAGLGLLALFIRVLLLTGTWRSNERRWLAQGKELTFAALAHEVRGPLAAISNAVSVLRLKGSDRQTVKWASDVVERQTRSIATQVDNLLDVSRVAQGKVRLHVKQVDLGTVVQHAAETALPLIEARGHTLDVLFPSEGLHVKADPDRLEQVLVNLLTNAAKYTPAGGCIRVQLERKYRQAVVRVCDNGIGIPPAFLPHVFDLFSQQKAGSQGGLGIGLYLARGLVRLHGGTITASAGPDKGSEFVVRLPLCGGPTSPCRVADEVAGGSVS
jgi:signal transduction histidine kinase